MQSNRQKIDQLIEQADDPVVKAVLMLISRHETSMQSMVESLEANTSATQKIATTLNDHVSKEEVFQARIEWSFIGGRIVAGITVTIIVAALSYIWARHVDEATREAIEQHEIARQVAINTQRLNALEQAVTEIARR